MLRCSRLRELGITVIADLCHFGVPDWLGGFQDVAFPIHFASYAREFALRYPWVRHFTPVNEIFICASFSALRGWWNECLSSDRAFVTAMRNLCMANELAVEAILSVRPDAIIVQGESAEHFIPMGKSSQRMADHWNGIKHLSLDLTLGHQLDAGMAAFLNDNGVTSNDLSFFREKRAVGQRWLGLDYYSTCEHRIAANGRQTVNHKGIGFRSLARAYYDRYRIPLFHCETNSVSDHAVSWLERQWGDVIESHVGRRAGARLHLVLAHRSDRLAACAQPRVQRAAPRRSLRSRSAHSSGGRGVSPHDQRSSASGHGRRSVASNGNRGLVTSI